MRLRSLPSVPGRSLVSAAVLKASASFWGLRPVEKVGAGWCVPAQGDAAAVTAAMRLESLANGSFSAERAAHLRQCRLSRPLSRQVPFRRLHLQAPDIIGMDATPLALPRNIHAACASCWKVVQCSEYGFWQPHKSCFEVKSAQETDVLGSPAEGRVNAASHLSEWALGAELSGLRLPGSTLASQMDSMSVLTLLLCPGRLASRCAGPCPGPLPRGLSTGLLSCCSMSSVACVRLSSDLFLPACAHTPANLTMH